MRSSRAESRRGGRGFTLIELMVVILIIAILAAISIAVGAKVTENGKKAATQDVIRVLDTTLTAYIADHDGKIPKVYHDEQGSEFPIADVRRAGQVSGAYAFDSQRDFANPSTALLLAAIGADRNANSPVAGLPSKFVQTRQFSFLPAPESANVPAAGSSPWFEAPNEDTDYDPRTGNVRRMRTPFGTPRDSDDKPVPGLFPVDAWGNLIRFVHPAYDGGYGDYYDENGTKQTRDNLSLTVMNGGNPVVIANLRRSYRPFDPSGAGLGGGAGGDADEGICPGNAAYFYSGGSDGDAGTREDNVYTAEPAFPPETKDLN